MTKKRINLPPVGITLVTLQGIAELSGASMAKVGIVTRIKKYGFPPVAHWLHRKAAYDLAKVVPWLEENHLKSMVFTRVDRESFKSAKKGIAAEAELVDKLKIGVKPVQPRKGGKTTTVHLKARHEYPEPRQHPSRDSNNCEHRISVSF